MARQPGCLLVALLPEPRSATLGKSQPFSGPLLPHLSNEGLDRVTPFELGHAKPLMREQTLGLGHLAEPVSQVETLTLAY